MPQKGVRPFLQWMIVYLADLASRDVGLERAEWPDTPETGNWVVKGKATKTKVATLLSDVANANSEEAASAEEEPGSSDDDKPLGPHKR